MHAGPRSISVSNGRDAALGSAVCSRTQHGLALCQTDLQKPLVYSSLPPPSPPTPAPRSGVWRAAGAGGVAPAVTLVGAALPPRAALGLHGHLLCGGVGLLLRGGHREQQPAASSAHAGAAGAARVGVCDPDAAPPAPRARPLALLCYGGGWSSARRPGWTSRGAWRAARPGRPAEASEAVCLPWSALAWSARPAGLRTAAPA